MSSIRRTKNGRYQADIQDKLRGIPRTKRTFDTRKEAQEWLDAVRREGTNRLLGHKGRRLFGEALIEYLKTRSPRKRTYLDDLSNAAALRWPIWDPESRRWLRLEETPLEEVPKVLAKWVADLKGVLDRRYIDNQLYQLRKKPNGTTAWYFQYDPRKDPNAPPDARPEPRTEVTDVQLLQRLARKRGRGPFSTGTLRVRQALVSSVLRCAWKYWGWLDYNVAERIDFEPPADEKGMPLDWNSLLRLLIAAPPHFDDAILAAVWIGWRRANILGGYKRNRPVRGLSWDHVVFPVYKEDPATGELVEIQPGYYYVDRFDSKNKKPLAQPMTKHVEQLLRMRWEVRNGPLVFHRGDGRPWGDFKKVWEATKKRAGVDPRLRWHDLRHTWATTLTIAGGHERHIQELGGWKDRRSMERYTHLALAHLRQTAELGKKIGTG